MGNPFKKKSFRQAVIGKKVKIVSHVGPAYKNRIGTIVDVKNGSVVEVDLGVIILKVPVKGLVMAK